MWLTQFYQRIFSEFLAIGEKKKKMKVLVAQSCPTLCDPMLAHQASLSMKFSRQEYWNG